MERANIVQSRLDEENAALSKRQAAFQRNRDHMDPNDEAEYERYCQEAMFRIQILEQRLDRHIALAQKVRRDGRAAAQRPAPRQALAELSGAGGACWRCLLLLLVSRLTAQRFLLSPLNFISSSVYDEEHLRIQYRGGSG